MINHCYVSITIFSVDPVHEHFVSTRYRLYEHGSFLESVSTGTTCSFHTLLCTHSVACFGFVHFSTEPTPSSVYFVSCIVFVHFLNEPLHTILYDINKWGNIICQKYTTHRLKWLTMRILRDLCLCSWSLVRVCITGAGLPSGNRAKQLV